MKNIDYKAIYQRIRLMLDNSDYSVIDLTKHLGKTRQLMYNWQNGKMNPTLPDLLKIANFFGVPLEYLISGEESPIDDATAAFIVSTHGLTEEQKKVIYASIKAQVDMFKKLNEDKQ